MRLSDDELRDVLARAEEIERVARHGSEWKAEVSAVVRAGEEVGLSRRSIERALSERLDHFTAPPAIDSLVWARSVDGKSYVARVLATSEDGVQVGFLRGSERVLPLDELRPCSFLPGERVTCDWPWWGPWTCTVVAYDAPTGRVKLSDGWGYTRRFRIDEVWLAPPKATTAPRTRIYLTLAGAGAVVGAAIGGLVTALLLR